ncbi:hypothetical protein AC625_16955 [Peribacillus loiseleuriae]|uniref:Uncharacterized protein n=1 Tax=Peribacillus loiseleuriae TaxID=1679170 RepID=A0A0K9GWJ3_9BACI|nr:hypothetical protein AC625_16955 [Peribacillus loiseleuriae]
MIGRAVSFLRSFFKINQIVEALDVLNIVDTLYQVDEYTRNTILPKYGAHLPGGSFARKKAQLAKIS